MITYEKLWQTMKEKSVSQYKLINYYRFSSGQLSRLRQNMYVSTRTIEKLCRILNCQPEDIVEVKTEPDSDSLS